MTAFGSILLGLVSGIAGWFASEFIAKPTRLFFDLRRETDRQLTMLAISEFSYEINEDQTPTNPDAAARANNLHVETKSAIENLGAQFIAFARTEALASRIIGWLGFSARSAGGCLLNLGDHLSEWDERGRELRDNIAKALKFGDDR